MNERQRDLFLWVWSRRRKPGQMAIGLRGAGIGALGGLLFAFLLSPGSDAPAYDIIGQLAPMARVITLAVPAFALIGWLGANRIYASQEAMYRQMLQSGARVPDEKPVMQPGDRGPAVAVGIAVAIIAGFIIFLIVQYG